MTAKLSWILRIVALFCLLLLISSLSINQLNILGCLEMLVVGASIFAVYVRVYQIKVVWQRVLLSWMCVEGILLSMQTLLFHKFDSAYGIVTSGLIVAYSEYRRWNSPASVDTMSPFLRRLWTVFRPEDNGQKAEFKV